jgi:hypothetical protein
LCAVSTLAMLIKNIDSCLLLLRLEIYRDATGTLNQVWLGLGKFYKTGLILNLIDYPKFEIIKTGSSGLITNYE